MISMTLARTVEIFNFGYIAVRTGLGLWSLWVQRDPSLNSQDSVIHIDTEIAFITIHAT